MKNTDIVILQPGDLVELKFICQVDEVKFTADGGYFIKASKKEGPIHYDTIEIDMSIAGDKIRKLEYNAFLGDFT